MARKKINYDKHKVVDTKYNNRIIGRLINILMVDGKKILIENIVYKALKMIQNRLNLTTDAELINEIESIIHSAKATHEVKSTRIGGSSLAIPREIHPRRAESLALKWIKRFSPLRKEKDAVQRIAGELLDIKNNIGQTVQKRDSTNKQADASKVFAHHIRK